jgi:hypothetical protein
MPWSTSLRLAGASALLVFAGTSLAACGTSPSTTQAVTAAVPTPSAAEAVSAHLPVEHYLLTPLQAAELTWLENRSEHNCMAGYGFDYPKPAPRPSATDVGTLQYSVTYRRYGVTDPRFARTWGYHPPVPGQVRPADTAQSSKAGAGLPSGDEYALLMGHSSNGTALTSYHGRPVPPGGCTTQAAALFPDVSSPQGPGAAPGQPLSALKSSSWSASLGDPRVTSVFLAWQACMSAAGFHVSANPLEAGTGLASINAPAPDRAELAMAEADVRCKASTDLVGVWFAVESDYQNTAIAQQQSVLDQIRQQRDRTVQRIEQLYAPAPDGSK